MTQPSHTSPRPVGRAALVSVVTPVFNEAGVLEEFLRQVSQALEQAGASYEIVFVNDGSSDGSGEKLNQL
ncbi:MAG: glycosyltransferase, partial [Pirellulales bacterium]